MKKLLIVTLNLNRARSAKVPLLIIALIFALATCNDDKGDDTSPCTCLSTYGTTAHLGMNETCTCGGTDCTACTEQKTTIEGTTIPIRKEAGVTVQQMNDAVTIIKSAYSANATNLSGKITAVHVTITDKNWRYDLNKVVWVKLDNVFVTDYVVSLFEGIVDGLELGKESDD